MTFWEHLDELRRVVVRVLVALLAATVVAFCFKDFLFQIILGPQKPDFLLYRCLNALAGRLDRPGLQIEPLSVQLISTQLSSQFVIHMKTAFGAAAVVLSPYIVFELFRFVSPALYADEKRYAVKTVLWSGLLFWMGVLLDYFLIFPVSFRFLAAYQVSADVVNTFTLSSYMQTFLVMSFLMGLLFELPVLGWLFARLGLIDAAWMRRYRRHAIMVILIVSAVITPTGDVFTLSIVSLPIILLYELTIGVVGKSYRPRNVA